MERLEKSAALIAAGLNKEWTEVKVLENRGKAARVSLAVLKPSPDQENWEKTNWENERSQTFVPLSLLMESDGKHYAPRKFVNKKLPGGRKAKSAKTANEAEILDWLVQQNQDEMRSQAGREWEREMVAVLGRGEGSFFRERGTMDIDRDIRFARHYTGLALEYARNHPGEEAKALALHEAPFLIAKRAAVHPGVQQVLEIAG